MAKSILIISRAAAGFRRAGVEHPPGKAEYPASEFTADQMARLQAEPLLDVIEIGEDDPAADPTPDPKKKAAG